MSETIHNAWLLAAGVAAGITTLIHVFAGGPTIARPLLAAADIDEVAKLTNYYCWHLVSIILAAMSFAFIYGALTPGEIALAVMWTAIAAAFALWSVALVIWKRQRPLDLPQWTLFATIAGLGAAGLVSGPV